MGLFDGVSSPEQAQAAMGKFYGEEKDKPINMGGGTKLRAVGKFVFEPVVGVKGKDGAVFSPAAKKTSGGARQFSLLCAVADGAYKGDSIFYNVTLEPKDKTREKIEGTIKMLISACKVLTGFAPEQLKTGNEFEEQLMNQNHLKRKFMGLIVINSENQANPFQIKRIYPYEEGMKSSPDEKATKEILEMYSGSAESSTPAEQVSSGTGASATASEKSAADAGSADDGWGKA